jgi:hypothetical protein
MARSRRETDWRTLIRRVRSSKFTPIVSDRVFHPGPNTLREEWAEEIDYPYPVDNQVSLARLAQYLSATSRDELAAKEDFLEFSKRYLLEVVRREYPEQSAFLDTVEDELYDITYSEAADRLDYPRYDDETDNPLRILAELPLPIFITTSYYDFIEVALREAGKAPRTEICYWSDELLDDVPSVFEDEPDYRPDPDSPLVYHVNGLDKYPSSLVLTEDDYLDFLVKVSRDMDVVPRRVAQAMVDSSLLLLGYQLDDPNFRVLFRGLIKSKRASRRRLSLSIQLAPKGDSEEIIDERDAQEYLERYFDKANFDVYWGETQGFVQELWEHWEAQP